MTEVAIAPATADDVRAIALRRAFDDTAFRIVAAAAENGAVWAARDAGESVGVAVAHASREEWCVGDLYVEPSYRGNGIGARLLDAAFGGDPAERRRATLFDANDPAAAALALRRGMAFCAPVLQLAGEIPREEALAAMAAGDYRFAVERLDPVAHARAIDALDREVRGTERAEDHARFAEAATGSGVWLDGDFVAYAYVWPSGRIGPLATASAAYLVQALALAFVTLRRTYGASWCTAFIPATNVRLARAALRGGLRIEATRIFAGDAATGDLSRYAGFHPLLF